MEYVSADVEWEMRWVLDRIRVENPVEIVHLQNISIEVEDGDLQRKTKERCFVIGVAERANAWIDGACRSPEIYNFQDGEIGI